MINRCTHIPQILLPKRGTDLSKWAVIACDQYTSQPEYWEKVEEEVGDAPSALRLVLPEAYLENEDAGSRIRKIHETMRRYIGDGTLEALPSGVILTERHSGGDCPRRGLVMAFDLGSYEYTPDSRALIRPTEKTVVERIPPRLKVREGALIELPHIMLLIDDPDRSVIEPLFDKVSSFEKVYDTELMQEGGSIEGWFIPKGPDTDRIEDALAALCSGDAMKRKYGCTEEKAAFAYAVGDGNHSMAAAKAYWEEVRKGLTEEEIKGHPARFVLAEVINIHDGSLVIHPIHRVIFGVDYEKLFNALAVFYEAHGCRAYAAEKAPESVGSHCYPFYSREKNGVFVVEKPKWAIPVATIQAGLDAYLEAEPGAGIDYIHGSDVVKSLSARTGNIGFILPDIAKNDIFRGVVYDGVLPRKTFSIGEAHEKRYYIEAKSIVRACP